MRFAEVNEFCKYEDQGVGEDLVYDSFKSFTLLAFCHDQELLDGVFHILYLYLQFVEI